MYFYIFIHLITWTHNVCNDYVDRTKGLCYLHLYKLINYCNLDSNSLWSWANWSMSACFAGHPTTRPVSVSGFGMMWKWTWSTSWWAILPLFCRMLYPVSVVSSSRALAIFLVIGRISDKYSSGMSCSLAPCHFGMIRAWPRDVGWMSRKEKTRSVSISLKLGMSPLF